MSKDLEQTRATLRLDPSDLAVKRSLPVLVQLAGPGAVRRFVLDREVIRIGREVDSNEIVLSDPWVSRQHTQIVLDAGGARLEDRQSRNGCLLNSERVNSAPLTDGDLLQIGQATFKFLESGSAEAPFYQEVFRLAFRDPVTRSYSRRYFDESLEREILRASRRGHPLSVLLIDVDNFKQVNDSYGHKAGDRVLAATAAALETALRGDSITARFGGDEFAVLLPESDLDEATQVAEKLRKSVSALVESGELERAKITVSIGVACITAKSEIESETLLAAADSALYRAKKAGRNQVLAGGPEHHTDSELDPRTDIR